MSKKEKVSISGDKLFVLLNIFLASVFVGSFFVAVVDLFCDKINILELPPECNETIANAVQVVVAVISLVVSIVGIAISLQNEEVFGVKTTKLYSLRVNKHYSILQIIIISILLCVANLVFYMTNLIFASLGALLTALVFLLIVVCMEVPIMSKDEKALLSILKSSVVKCYLEKSEATKDLKDAIKYLIYSKNLKEVYDVFKHSSDQEYNKYLLLKLLELQHDLAFELKDGYQGVEQRRIASSLVENVLDIAFRTFDFSDETYREIQINKHLLTRVLFRVHELESTRDLLLNRIPGIYQFLFVASELTDERKEKVDLISSIIIILVTNTVKYEDFSVIKKVRKQLSSWKFGLENNSPAVDVFAVISMYLYYLCCSAKSVPVELRTKVIDFINESNIIEDRTPVVSWKKLFEIVARKFPVNYASFVTIASNNSNSMDYWLDSGEAQWLILDTPYFIEWYLTNLINARYIYKFDFERLITRNPSIRNRFISYFEKCLDDNLVFVPTDEMKQIIEFYESPEEPFKRFSIVERDKHTISKLINELKLKDLMVDTELANVIDEFQFASSIRNCIESAVKEEWGFDKDLSIENQERYFSVLLEKYPEATNFQESIETYCADSVISDIKASVKKRRLYCLNDDFDSELEKVLLKSPRYATRSLVPSITHYYIKSAETKQRFEEAAKTMIEFSSRILDTFSLVTDKGFRFNCKVNKVEFRNLTEEELAEQVKKHQRVDGQYVFNGVFIPKEELDRIIKAKYTILTVMVQHQVESSEDTVFSLKTFSCIDDD